MKLPRRRFLQLAAGAAALPAVSRLAWAQAYPSRPVRIISGFAAAGGTDIAARIMGQWLSERLGQPFIIENRPGANSNIAAEAVVRSAPDGYTLFLANSSNAINATLYEKLNFNFIRDTAPVAAIIGTPSLMIAHPLVPAANCCRVRRSCQGQSGKSQHGVGRQRERQPYGRRAFQDGGRRRHSPRALSRQALNGNNAVFSMALLVSVPIVSRRAS